MGVHGGAWHAEQYARCMAAEHRIRGASVGGRMRRSVEQSARRSVEQYVLSRWLMAAERTNTGRVGPGA